MAEIRRNNVQVDGIKTRKEKEWKNRNPGEGEPRKNVYSSEEENGKIVGDV